MVCCCFLCSWRFWAVDSFARVGAFGECGFSVADFGMRAPAAGVSFAVAAFGVGARHQSVDYVLALLLPLLCCFRLGAWGGRYWSWYFSVGVGIDAFRHGSFW